MEPVVIACQDIAFGAALATEEGGDGEVCVEFGVAEQRHLCLSLELLVEYACLEVVWVSLLLLHWS